MDNKRSLPQVFRDRVVQIMSEIFGIEPERAMSMGRLFHQVDNALFELDGWPWLHDLYRDDDGSIFAIASSQGKLFSYQVTVDGDDVSLGEPIRVEETFEPVRMTRTNIIRQADGSVRWVSVSCTSVLNRVGEIDSRALFDSFVEHAEETEEYPYRTFYHQGEVFKTGQADFLARDGNAYITSGIYDETSLLAPYEIAALEENPEFWGESIGYRATEQPSEIEVGPGVKIPVFNRGINSEISLLPQEDACAWFTHITNQQEVSRMRQKVMDALVDLVGDEEKAKEFAALVDNTNRAIDDDDMITRDGDQGGAQELVAKPDADPDVEREIVMDDATMDAITARFSEEIATAIAPIMDRITVIEKSVEAVARSLEEVSSNTGTALDSARERLAQLEVDEDTKRKEYQADMPRKAKTKVTYRPSQVMPGPQSLADAASATLAGMPSYPGKG